MDMFMGKGQYVCNFLSKVSRKKTGCEGKPIYRDGERERK